MAFHMFISEQHDDRIFISKALQVSNQGVFLLGRVKTMNTKSVLIIPSSEGPLKLAAEMTRDCRTLHGFGAHYKFLPLCSEKQAQVDRLLGNLHQHTTS